MVASFLEIVSRLFGWVYTLCWSLSFYPQPIVNFRRRSTSGTTIDFPAINVLGFVAYLTSNVAFLYSPHIRKEYALRHHGLTPTVQLNDVAFAGHAVILSVITVSQFFPTIWGFDKTGRRGIGTRVSKGVLAIYIGSFVGVATVAFIVDAKHDDNVKSGWAWIDVVRILLLRCREHLLIYCDCAGICHFIRQARCHPGQVHASNRHELSEPLDTGLVDSADTP
jgi:cystinosin